jgi:hypothetical protein
MKLTTFLLIGMSIVMAAPLRADPSEARLAPGGPTDTSGNNSPQESDYLKRHVKNLERMHADRNADTEHHRKAQEEFRKGTAEMSGHDTQHLQNLQNLRSVEDQITAGQEQKTLTRQSYKDAVQKYGTADPRSISAKESWKQSQEKMDPLLESRDTLKEDVHRGGRLLHNDKVLLSIQQRSMDSDARYRAIDDRKIQKEEKTISDERSAMTERVRLSVPPPMK